MRYFIIPLFWRYLLKIFFKIFFLSVGSFVSLLLLTRLKEIGRFAALSSDLTSVFLFVLYQIPYILPIAIPISSLIASFMLFHHLSESKELTALRSSGLSLKQLMTPLLLAGSFLFTCNLLIISELTSYCKIQSKEMLVENSATDPLFLLQKQDLLKIRDCFIDFKGGKDSAKEFFFLIYNKANKRLNLFTASLIENHKDELLGKEVSILTNLPGDTFDTLIIENQTSMSTSSPSLCRFMKSSHYSLNPNYLSLPTLLALNKLNKKSTESILAEILRRFSLSFCACSFTIVGICFGLEVGRSSSKKNILIASLLSLSILLSFILAKALRAYTLPPCLIYVTIQPLALFFCSRKLNRFDRGCE